MRKESVSERRTDLYLDDENASRQGPFFHLLYLPFLVLLSRPVTRRAPRRQPSVSGRRPRRAFAREPPNSSPTTPSAWLAGFRFAPLVYLFAYLFLGPLTLVYFSHPLLLPPTLSLSLPHYVASKGDNHRRIPQDREQRRSLDIKERSLERRGDSDNRYTD